MKKERNLLKLLSDKECLSASKEAFANAKKHKQSAESIANNESYGTAVSLLILGTEELVKGILLYIQHLGIDVRNVPSIHLFFTDHIIKHRLATLINLTYPILKLFLEFVVKTKEILHNPNSNIEYTDDENVFISRDEKKLQYLFRDIPGLMDWWEEANIKKNKGFYVDYSESMETPMQVTELEYKQALLIAVNFEKQILETVEYMEKFTEEDKFEIAKNSKKHKIDKLLKPIIDSRKEEMKNKSIRITVLKKQSE